MADSPSPASPPALLDDACYPHPAETPEMIETHISWVFLAGAYAYKIKKPVRLPFLDFSTLEARRACCEEELRLNRRTAPHLYLEVVPIAGTPGKPVVGGREDPFEYAVKMRRFGQESLASRVAARGELGMDRIDALAEAVARFHAANPSAADSSPFGDPAQVAGLALENFDELAPLADAAIAGPVARLRAWTEKESARLEPVFAARKRSGFVRECHGDLHLGNIVLLDGAPVPFDCIEFNAALRWIDVMSDAAFLVMDLREHGLGRHAARFVNTYLEATGDYGGLRVLAFYVAYRAAVRAKVALIRAQQEAGDARDAGRREAGRYLAFAEAAARPHAPALAIMHGLAGSGKTTFAQMLVEHGGAIRVRSDVERKRLHGLGAQARTHAAPYAGIYAPETTRLTYDRLKDIVRDVVESGYAAIVDAAFLSRTLRAEFRSFARELGVPFLIVSCRAAPDELRRRVALRAAELKDASEAGVDVLENQLATGHPLAGDELADAVMVDAQAGLAALDAEARRIAARHFVPIRPGAR